MVTMRGGDVGRAERVDLGLVRVAAPGSVAPRRSGSPSMLLLVRARNFLLSDGAFVATRPPKSSSESSKRIVSFVSSPQAVVPNEPKDDKDVVARRMYSAYS